MPSDDPELSGMGTTVTAIALLENADEPLLSIANVGDSRTYRFTASGLEQLTEDHSVIGELMRDGRITAEEALQHRHRSVITRALGVEPSVDVDIIEVIPSPGDRYLLCSDGLYSEVADSAIASILRRFADPKEACEELMAAAMRGGRDNITVVIVDVVDDADPAYQASLALGAAAASNGRSAATVTLDPISGTNGAKAAGTATAAKATANLAREPKVKRARKPSPINLRVLLFIAVLAGLGAIVAWVWKNAPESDIVPNTTVITTDADVPAGPATPVTTLLGTVDPSASTTSGTTTPGSTTPGTTTPGTTTPASTASGAATQATTPAVGVAIPGGSATTLSTVLATTTTDPFDTPTTSKATKSRKKST